MTDHAAIDLDQKAIDTDLKKFTMEGFTNANNIYENIGNSKSFTIILINTSLTMEVPKGTTISGINTAGVKIIGKSKANFVVGATEIDVQYQTADNRPHVTCRVSSQTLSLGAVTEGCLAGIGTVKVGEIEYAYTYDIMEENINGHTLMGFSTAAEENMYS